MKQVRKKKTRFSAAVLMGIVAAIIGGKLLGWKLVPLVGWDVGALTFLIMLWHDFAGHDGERTAGIAKRDDMDHSTIDVILVVASLVSIVAVAILLTGSAAHSNPTKLFDIGFGLLSIVISWTTVHSIYMLRYAAMYYHNDARGVNFNDKLLPRFSDFAYLAFTIGMTYQVSDNNFESPDFRKVAIRHAMLSFVFGVAIIATTINFIASLAK